jgi:hypothetical protein
MCSPGGVGPSVVCERWLWSTLRLIRFTPLPLPALRRSVPGNAGWGSRAGAALCPAPAPSMDDTLDRYRHFLAGTPPHVLPARPVPTLFTLMRKVPYGPLYPE